MPALRWIKAHRPVGIVFCKGRRSDFREPTPKETAMTNIGSTDRMLRFIAGLALLVLPFLPFANGLLGGMGAWKFAIAAIGGVLLATATFRFCPAYRLLGIRTCKIGGK
jgi:hypothetical protein